MTASKIPDQLIYDLEDSMTRLARLMATRHTDPGFCSGSLNMSQMMLMRAFESHDALKMSDVALLLAVKPPAASATVDGLEKQRLCRAQDLRGRPPRDARTHHRGRAGKRSPTPRRSVAGTCGAT